MKHNEIHTYTFRKVDTNDSGEAVGNSFWDILNQINNNKNFGEGTYKIWNHETGNIGEYEIKDGKRKRLSVIK